MTTGRNPRIDVQIRLRDALSRGLNRARQSARNFGRQMSNLSSSVSGASGNISNFNRTKERMERNMQDASRTTKGFADRMRGFGTGLRNVGRSITENVTLPMGALILAFRELDQQFQRVAIAENFENTARKFGFAADSVIASLRQASGGTVNSMALMQRASEAMALQVAPDLETMRELMLIARNQARIMGITTEEAFRRIVLGIGKAEKEIIEETGLLFNATLAFQEHAKVLGKSSQELDQYEKTAAILNQVLIAGRKNLEGTNLELLTNSEKLAVARARFRDTADELIIKLLPAMTALVELLNKVPKPVLQFVIAGIFLLAVLGPLLQTIALIVLAGPGLAKFFVILKAGALRAIPAVAGLSLSMGTLLALFLAAAAVGILFALAWERNWGNIRGITERAINAIIAQINGLIDSLNLLLKPFDFFNKLFGGGGVQISRLADVTIPGANQKVTGPLLNPQRMANVTNVIVPEGSAMFFEDESAMGKFADIISQRINIGNPRFGV